MLESLTAPQAKALVFCIQFPLRSCIAALVLSGAAVAQVSLANFDAQSEGGIGTSYAEDGIVFSDLDRYLGSAPDSFTIEEASSTLAGMPGFTAPNTLAFGGYSSGPSAAFGRCGKFLITPPGVRDSAELHIYTFGSSSAGNQILLEAKLTGAVVATDSVLLPTASGVHEFTLTINGADFDSLQVTGQGASNSGAFFGLVDSVRVENASVGSAFCFGDGSALACPCANNGAAGKGCANSADAGGAELGASGVASLSASSLVLAGNGLVPGQPGLYFQGDNAVGGGGGVIFGDGLRCAGGNVVRLEVVTASGAGASATSTDLGASSSAGPGDTKRYQLWYRDPVGGPCGTGFNLSNGIELDWTL